jgi:uncharacterized protein YtpQ (UPF0354 family)
MSHDHSSRLAALLAAAAILAACSRDPSAAFTSRVADRLKAAAKGADVAVVAPLQVAVTPKEGKRTTLDLTDLWKSCGSRVDCGEPVDGYVRSVVANALVVEAPAKREYLRPLIRLKSNLSTAEAAAVSEPLAGELVIVYVFDSGAARRPVAPADLQTLGLDKAGLRSAAVANLKAAAAEIPHEATDAERVYVVSPPDGYAAARLLQLEGWEPLKAEVQGDLIAIAPHERYVFFSGSGEDKATRDRLRALAADRMDGADGLSPVVLKWTPQGWVPFTG